MVTAPQVLPKREQKAALDSGWQAQVLFAPQLVGATQVPQLATVRAAPQLSCPVTCPQVLPNLAQKATSGSGWQTHVLFVHSSFASQLPQFLLIPQALEPPPHSALVGQATAGQTHWLLAHCSS